MAPAVTVVIPTHNRPHELRLAVRSVLAQTHTDWRLIIVDDGSEQPVTSETLGTDDARVTVVRHDTARGVARARNAGIAQADTPWVAFLDDDDLWAPGKLARQLADADRTGATMLFGSATYVTPDGLWIYDRIVAPADGLGAQLLTENVVGEPSTVLVDRELLAQAGGFDPAFSTLADWDLWLRLSEIATPLAGREPATAILVHAGSMQLVDQAGAERELALLADRHRDLAERCGRPLGSARIDMWLADKRRRADPRPATALAYTRSAIAAEGPVKVVRRFARRAHRRLRPVPAPDWVLQLRAP
ncbi:MAG: glycosyltransferase family 2 protein [Baekduiaceae bacterium]